MIGISYPCKPGMTETSARPLEACSDLFSWSRVSLISAIEKYLVSWWQCLRGMTWTWNYAIFAISLPWPKREV
jgi:hypothetical protein